MNAIKNLLTLGPAFGLGGAKLNQLRALEVELGDRVLEEGCAMGFVIGNVNAKEKHGIDIEPKSLEYAQRTYPDVAFSVKPAGDSGFQDCFFDSILCLDVMEHVQGDIRLLDEAKRMLKPGGRLVISTPIKGANLLPYAGLLTEKLHKAWGHVRVYGKKELHDLLTSRGFSVVKTREHAYLLTRLVFYAYLKASEMKLKKSGLAWVESRLVKAIERLIMLTDALEAYVRVGKPFQMFVVAVKPR